MLRSELGHSPMATNAFNIRFRQPDKSATPPLSYPGDRDITSEFDSVMVNWINYNRVPLTAGMITGILCNADYGWSRDQAALLQAILQKEPVLLAHLQTRIQTVLSLKWSVLSDTEDMVKARAVEDILKKANITSLFEHLLDAIPTGYAGSLVNWAPGAGSISSFQHVHPCNWIFDMEGNPAVVLEDGNQVGLNDFHPYQFVFHTHSVMPGIPSIGGLTRCLIWLAFYKHYGMKHRARYLEKFGIPFLVTKISDSDFANPTTRAAIKQALRDIGADGAGVFTQGSDIVPVSAGAQGENASYQQWFEYIDKVFAVTVLGQEATSKAATGFSQGNVQAQVRQDILAKDCNKLMETINNNIIRPLEWYRYRTETLRLNIEYQPAEDIGKKLDTLAKVKNAGYEIDPQWVEDTFNLPLVNKSAAKKPSAPIPVSAPAPAAPPPDLAAALGGQPPPAPMSDLSDDEKKKIFELAFADAQVDDKVRSSDLPEEIKTRLLGAEDPRSDIGVLLSDPELDPAVRSTLDSILSSVPKEPAASGEQPPAPPPTTEGESKEPPVEQPPPVVEQKIPTVEQTTTPPAAPPPPAEGKSEEAKKKEKQAKEDADQRDSDMRLLNTKLSETLARAANHNLGDEGLANWVDTILNEFPASSYVRKNIDRNELVESLKPTLRKMEEQAKAARLEAGPAVIFEKPPPKPEGFWENVARGVSELPSNVAEAFNRSGETVWKEFAGVAEMLGSEDARKFAENLDKYKAAEDEQNPIKGDNLLTQSIYAVAGMAPGMIPATIAGLSGAGPVGAAIAFGLQGTGSLYHSMRQQGVDSSIAIPAALLGGTVSGALGSFQLGKMIPQAYRQEGESVVRAAVSKWLGENSGKIAAFGENIASQTAAMAADTSTRILLEDLSKRINDSLKGTELAKDSDVMRQLESSLEETLGSVEATIPMTLLTHHIVPAATAPLRKAKAEKLLAEYKARGVSDADAAKAVEAFRKGHSNASMDEVEAARRVEKEIKKQDDYAKLAAGASEERALANALDRLDIRDEVQRIEALKEWTDKRDTKFTRMVKEEMDRRIAPSAPRPSVPKSGEPPPERRPIGRFDEGARLYRELDKQGERDILDSRMTESEYQELAKENPSVKDPVFGSETYIEGMQVPASRSRLASHALGRQVAGIEERVGGPRPSDAGGEVGSLRDRSEREAKAIEEVSGGRRLDADGPVVGRGESDFAVNYRDRAEPSGVLPDHYTRLGGGLEADVFGSDQDGVVFKFQTKNRDGLYNGGISYEVDPVTGKIGIVPGNQTAGDVVSKAHVLSRLGGVPTNLVGITKNDFIVFEQPKGHADVKLEPWGKPMDRARLAPASDLFAPVESQASGHPGEVHVGVVDGVPYIIADLRTANLVTDTTGKLRISDAFVRRITESDMKLVPGLRKRVEQARQLELDADAAARDRSNRKFREPSDTKAPVTPAMDAEYMAAVERGDTETAQRMVDDAARRAGYDIEVYHGTDKDFTVFDKGGRVGIYTTPDKKYAGQYGKKVLKLYAKIDKRAKTNTELTTLESIPRGVDWLVDTLKKYDGIISEPNAGNKEILLKNPSQIKSADPVTRDSTGRVIPLSERFNEKKDDIRYRETTDMEAARSQLPKEVRDWLDSDFSVLPESDRNILADAIVSMTGPEASLETVKAVADSATALGSVLGKAVRVREGLSKPETFVTAFHEVSHIVDTLLTKDELAILDKLVPDQEVRAEIVGAIIAHDLARPKGMSEKVWREVKDIFLKIGDIILSMMKQRRKIETIADFADKVRRGYYAKEGGGVGEIKKRDPGEGPIKKVPSEAEISQAETRFSGGVRGSMRELISIGRAVDPEVQIEDAPGKGSELKNKLLSEYIKTDAGDTGNEQLVSAVGPVADGIKLLANSMGINFSSRVGKTKFNSEDAAIAVRDEIARMIRQAAIEWQDMRESGDPLPAKDFETFARGFINDALTTGELESSVVYVNNKPMVRLKPSEPPKTEAKPSEPPKTEAKPSEPPPSAKPSEPKPPEPAEPEKPKVPKGAEETGVPGGKPPPPELPKPPIESSDIPPKTPVETPDPVDPPPPPRDSKTVAAEADDAMNRFATTDKDGKKVENDKAIAEMEKRLEAAERKFAALADDLPENMSDTITKMRSALRVSSDVPEETAAALNTVLLGLRTLVRTMDLSEAKDLDQYSAINLILKTIERSKKISAKNAERLEAELARVERSASKLTESNLIRHIREANETLDALAPEKESAADVLRMATSYGAKLVTHLADFSKTGDYTEIIKAADALTSRASRMAEEQEERIETTWRKASRKARSEAMVSMSDAVRTINLFLRTMMPRLPVESPVTGRRVDLELFEKRGRVLSMLTRLSTSRSKGVTPEALGSIIEDISDIVDSSHTRTSMRKLREIKRKLDADVTLPADTREHLKSRESKLMRSIPSIVAHEEASVVEGAKELAAYIESKESEPGAYHIFGQPTGREILKVLSDLDGRSYSDLSGSELTLLRDGMERAASIGKLDTDQANRRDWEGVYSDIDTLKNTVGKLGVLAKDVDASPSAATTRRSLSKKLGKVDKFVKSNWLPFSLCKLVDGVDEGPLYRRLVEALDDAQSELFRTDSVIKNTFFEKLGAAGFNDADSDFLKHSQYLVNPIASKLPFAIARRLSDKFFQKSVPIHKVKLSTGDLDMTMAEFMSVWLHSNTVDGMIALTSAPCARRDYMGSVTELHFTPEDVAVMRAYVESDKRALAVCEAMYKTANTVVQDVMSSTYKNVTGKDLKLVEGGYWGQTKIGYASPTDSSGNLVIGNSFPTLTNMSSASPLKERTGGGRLLITDAYEDFYNMRHYAAAYKGFGRKVRLAKALLDDPGVKERISSYHGADIFEELNNVLARAIGSDPRTELTNDMINDFMTWARQAASSSTIPLSPVAILSNPWQIPVAMREIWRDSGKSSLSIQVHGAASFPGDVIASYARAVKWGFTGELAITRDEKTILDRMDEASPILRDRRLGGQANPAVAEAINVGEFTEELTKKRNPLVWWFGAVRSTDAATITHITLLAHTAELNKRGIDQKRYLELSDTREIDTAAARRAMKAIRNGFPLHYGKDQPTIFSGTSKSSSLIKVFDSYMLPNIQLASGLYRDTMLDWRIAVAEATTPEAKRKATADCLVSLVVPGTLLLAANAIWYGSRSYMTSTIKEQEKKEDLGLSGVVENTELPGSERLAELVRGMGPGKDYAAYELATGGMDFLFMLSRMNFATGVIGSFVQDMITHKSSGGALMDVANTPAGAPITAVGMAPEKLAELVWKIIDGADPEEINKTLNELFVFSLNLASALVKKPLTPILATLLKYLKFLFEDMPRGQPFLLNMLERALDKSPGEAVSDLVSKIPTITLKTMFGSEVQLESVTPPITEEKTFSFADASSFSPEFVREAYALVKAKELLESAARNFDMKRTSVEPELKASEDQTIELPVGTVAYVQGHEGMVVNRTKLIAAMMRAFKVDAAAAAKVLESGSTPKETSSYVKVLLKKADALVPAKKQEESK